MPTLPDVTGVFPDVLKAPEKSTGGRVARMPLFRALGNKNASLIDVIRFYKNFGKLLYVPRWTDQVPIDEERLVIVCDQASLDLLRRIFVYHSDYSKSLDAQEKARKKQDDREVRELKLSSQTLLKVEINDKGIRGELALPVEMGSRESVKFCKKNVLAVQKPLYPGSVVIGVVNSDQFMVNESFSDVELFSREKQVLLDGVKRIYQDLVDLFLVEADPGRIKLLRRFILNFYYQQKHAVNSEYRVMDAQLEIRILNLSMIPITDGRFVSLNVVLEMTERVGYVPFINTGEEGIEIPAQEAVLLLEPGSYFQKFCRRVIGVDNLVHYRRIIDRREQARKLEELKHQREQAREENQKLREKLEQHKQQRQEQAQKLKSQVKKPRPGASGDDVLPSAVPVSEPVPAKTEPDTGLLEEVPLAFREDLSDEDRFLFALKRELRIIREVGDYKLSEKVLKNMTVGYLEDKPSGPV